MNYRTLRLQNIFILIAISSCLVLAETVRASDEALPNIQQQVDQFQQKMKQQKGGPKVTEQDMALMKKAQDDLARTLPHPGIKVGQKAPDFTLGNADGVPVHLYEQLKSGPVILIFYRGAWCPYCNIQLHALQKSLPTFKKYNAQLIAVTPQTPDKSREQIKKDKYPFQVLSDLKDTVSTKYNLYFRVNQKLNELYKTKFGLDIEAYNGKGRAGLPVPGSFVVAQDGTIVAMHADLDYKKRMEPVDIVKALKTIKK